MKLFHNKKAVNMKDWFTVVFSLIIGIIVFFGGVALIMVSENAEEQTIVDVSTEIGSEATLYTLLRTPIQKGMYSNKNELEPIGEYLASKNVNTAQLFDLMGKEQEFLFFIRDATDLPPALQSRSAGDRMELFQVFLNTHINTVFSGVYGKEWGLNIEYPETYSPIITKYCPQLNVLEKNAIARRYAEENPRQLGNLVPTPENSKPDTLSKEIDFCPGLPGTAVALDLKVPTMDGSQTITFRLVRRKQ